MLEQKFEKHNNIKYFLNITYYFPKIAGWI